MTVLLDSSTLIAVGLVGHVHYDAVDAWLAELDEPFATCAITQGALLRTALRTRFSVEQSMELIELITSDPRHEFWAEDFGFDEVRMDGVIGHRQVTDAYLAQLTRNRNARVATLDRGFAAHHDDVAVLVPA